MDAALGEQPLARVQQSRARLGALLCAVHTAREGCAPTCFPARNPNTSPLPSVPPPLGYAQPKTLAAVFPAAYSPSITPPSRRRTCASALIWGPPFVPSIPGYISTA